MRTLLLLVLLTFLLEIVLGSEDVSSSLNNDGGPSYLIPINTEFEYGSEIPVVKKGGGFYQLARCGGGCDVEVLQLVLLPFLPRLSSCRVGSVYV